MQEILGVIAALRRWSAPVQRRAEANAVCLALKAVCLDSNASVLAEYAIVTSLLSVGTLGGLSAIGTLAAGALTTVQSELLNYGLRNGL